MGRPLWELKCCVTVFKSKVLSHFFHISITTNIWTEDNVDVVLKMSTCLSAAIVVASRCHQISHSEPNDHDQNCVLMIFAYKLRVSNK